MAKVLMLPGDGIGPEVVHAAHRVIQTLNQIHSANIECEFAEIGGASIDTCGEPYSSSCNELAHAADAILLGAVGGPKWDILPAAQRPERGLLAIRAQLELFANLRPALVYPSLVDASSLKPELVSGLDILIVRELTGGIYFGEPRGQIKNDSNVREAFNTDRYSETEIERIAHVAFQFAQQRIGKKVCSVDKANVLEVSQLWREVVERVAREYPTIELSHMYVDNAAMQLVKQPKQFDVMLTSNLFGDILSDEAAMLTGSIGMLPSASMRADKKGLFEPCHGSAPDIAGKGIANPLATILSLAMLLRFSLNQEQLASLIERAVANVLEQGFRTADLAVIQSETKILRVSTDQMTDEVIRALQKISN